MERRTKIAGGYLALCCVFMVFTCVSSVKFYNPDHYIKRIVELLDELHRALTKMNVGDIKLEGPRDRALEYGKDCAGTFLDIYQSGTKDISNLVLPHSVHNITDSIDDCATKLRRVCQNLQKRDPQCKDFNHKENLIDFVKDFRKFSKLIKCWKICGTTFRPEYEFMEEYDPDTASLCGRD